VSLNLNQRAFVIADHLADEALRFRVKVSTGSLGERLIDAGSRTPGGIAAGLLLARMCMGGLSKIRSQRTGHIPSWPWSISIACSQPAVSCLASQYAGWSLSHDDFFALGSGPARALAQKEEIFKDIGYGEKSGKAVLVLESAAPPPAEIVASVAEACRVKPKNLTIAYAPTQSIAGGVQVVARALEVALHKVHALKFPLDRIVDGLAAAPLPPPHPDFVTAMGRTNDAIIFGGEAHLFVTGSAAEAKGLAEALPSRTSRDYGKPFAEVFAAFKGDFYAIDPMLFSPAKVLVTALDTGETFKAGGFDEALIDASFR
jgi:methenyltetrahydromethanopterin cyclohydrolase